MRLRIVLLIFTLSWTLHAQALEDRLGRAYNNFEDSRLDSMLIAANSAYDSLDVNDRISFHKFSAFRAFQNNQTPIVSDHFRQLIELNPAYTLDPVTTSPKLIMMFDKAKIEYLEQQQKRLRELNRTPAKAELPWRSLVFPGWEQWRRGAQTKAVIWGTLGVVSLAGTVQAIVRTSSARNDYLDAANSETAGRLYREYNELYRSQYYWAYGLAAVWLTSHIDAVYLTPETEARISFGTFKDTSPRISLTVNF